MPHEPCIVFPCILHWYVNLFENKIVLLKKISLCFIYSLHLASFEDPTVKWVQIGKLRSWDTDSYVIYTYVNLLPIEIGTKDG